MWVTFIQTYAPTEDSEEGVKDSFYDSLEELITKVPKGDHLVVMGDLNARVGSDHRLLHSGKRVKTRS